MSPTATQEDQIHEVDDEEMQSVGAMRSHEVPQRGEKQQDSRNRFQDIDSQ